MVVVLNREIVVMKNLVCLLVLAGLLSCAPKLSPSVEPEPAPAPEVVSSTLSTPMDESILRYINDYRRSKGLSSLQPLDAATQQAYLHSKNMATGKTGFGHSGFKQRVAVIQKTTGVSASAENVAYGQLSAKEVVKGWINSPGHKRNIEGKYTLTGIGTYKDREGTIYFTQIFISK
jgi:uncharacterized protein YkwD